MREKGGPGRRLMRVVDQDMVLVLYSVDCPSCLYMGTVDTCSPVGIMRVLMDRLIQPSTSCCLATK